MAITLRGSCRCGALRFAVRSHTPHPYQLCYCSICRKTAGGGGYAINIMGVQSTLSVEGGETLAIYRAEIADEDGRCSVSSGQRHFCARCASALWMFDPQWPTLVHPFASAIDTQLPQPPQRVHILLRSKPSWVKPSFRRGDLRFKGYPEQSIEDWHKTRGLWLD